MQRWERTFWVVFVANLVTAVGMMSFLPFFPSILEGMGLTDRDEIAAWAGVTFGAAPLAAAFMGPIWGSIGDRFGRKVMVLRSMVAIAVFVGAMGFARTPWQLLVLRLSQGVFSGFVPPSNALVSISAPQAMQGRIAGSLQASLAAGAIVGPLLGALVESTLGIHSIFFFVSAAAGLSALLVGLFAHEDHSLRVSLERWSPSSVLAGAWGDLARLLKKRPIRSAVVVLFTVQIGMGATNPLLELFVRDIWEGDRERVPQLTAYLFTAMAGAALFATPLWGRIGDRIGHSRALVVAAALSAAVLFLHSVAAGFVTLAVARVLIGCFSTGPNTTAAGIAATGTKVENRGVAFGAVFSARAFAVSLGSVLGGAASAVVGIRGLFVLAGTLVVVVLVLQRPRAGRAGRGGQAGQAGS